MSLLLSPDQAHALDKIKDEFFSSWNNNPTAMVLKGSAGTGKSTIVKLLAEAAADERTVIKYCATTHRAAGVLKDILWTDVTTAYTAFNLRPGVDRFGKQRITAGGKPRVPYKSIVVIDEASMIDDVFLRKISEIIKERHLRVLFVGDPYQLPPVKGKCSLFDGSLPTVELTTVHRQNHGNPILDKAIEFRDFIAGTRKTMPEIKHNVNVLGEGIHSLNHDEFVQAFVARHIDYKAGDPVHYPMCVYTNESAINYNNLIRKSQYFLSGNIEPFYPGELMVSNSIVMSSSGTAVLNNNETVKVIQYSAGNLGNCPGYYIDVERTVDGNLEEVSVFMPRDAASEKKYLAELKKRVLDIEDLLTWPDFYAIKNGMADLRPPFAGTTHKAQGGTFKSVFIDQTNIRKCKDPIVQAKLMYVALTRATHDVYINSGR